MKIENHIEKLSQDELVEQVIFQIEKELNIKVERKKDFSLIEIEVLISQKLKEIFENDYQQFINLLYLVDVKESEINLDNQKYFDKLSNLIFKRILQKVVFRLYYKKFGVFPE
jgi:hypothetical protein